MIVTRKLALRTAAMLALATVGVSLAADAFAARCIPCSSRYYLWRKPKIGDPVEFNSRFDPMERVTLNPQPLPPRVGPGSYRGF